MEPPISCPSRPMEILPEPDILFDPPRLPEIPLPRGWSQHTLLAVLHVIMLARNVVMNVVNWPDKEYDGLRLRCENDRLRGEVEMLKKELAIKDSRFARLEPKKRPHYTSDERLEILTLRAMRGWSNTQVAQHFHVTVQTIINWMNGVEAGEDSKVAFAAKPNRYPDFVRYVVPQFKSFCPMLGRHKIAEVLCRAGLHLSASTVKWIIDQPPISPPELSTAPDGPESPKIKAWYSNHVWLVDLTVVLSTDGLWTPWPPNALTQVHPYSWYVMLVIDHFSRRIMGFDVFEQNPTAAQVEAAMLRIFEANGVKPKYLISDQGSQFVAAEFQAWCKANEIKQRFGAIGKHGSIAVTERAILTYKDSCIRHILVPISRMEMFEETRLFFEWYNEHRPHMTLMGKTPNEAYFGRHAANAKPRIETRPFAKQKTPCASPRMCIAGKAGAKVRVRLEFLEGRLHLPILKVERI